MLNSADIEHLKKQVQEIKERVVQDLIFEVIGDDPRRKGLKETPSRVVKAYQELFGGYKQAVEPIIKTFEHSDADEMIVVRGIDFVSFCEHHLLPFEGECNIGYLPDGHVLGLSKFARVVEIFSKRLQIQERLTEEIAKALHSGMKTKGVGVVIVASHKCMSCRGVKKKNASMVTSKMLGAFREDASTRAEFLSLIGVSNVG